MNPFYFYKHLITEMFGPPHCVRGLVHGINCAWYKHNKLHNLKGPASITVIYGKVPKWRFGYYINDNYINITPLFQNFLEHVRRAGPR